MLGTLINAGTSILGGLLDRRESRAGRSDAERWNERSYQLARDSFDWQKSYIQNRVADARKAGIHPLYALGTPGASASFTAGQSPTGSGLGTGLAEAGRAIAGGLRKKDPLQARLIEAQIQTQESQARLNDAEALAAASRAKRAEQTAITHRLPPSAPIARQALTDYVPKRGVKRAVEVGPIKDIAPRGWATTPWGDRIPWFHDESGFDEVGQAYNLYEWEKSRAKHARKDARPLWRWMFDPEYRRSRRYGWDAPRAGGPSP